MAVDKSLEQRLFEAFMGKRGLRLTAYDVALLVIDDAIATRITDEARFEAGVDKNGQSDFNDIMPRTWKKFVRHQAQED